MINVKKGIDILRAYELEGYRRLYAASIDKNGNCGNFDEILFVNNNQSENDKIIINFDDYYCPHITQKNIISKLLEEEYKINNGAKTYKLNKHNKEVLEYRIYLGVAPNSSLSGFKIRHADYDKKIFDMLNDED